MHSKMDEKYLFLNLYQYIWTFRCAADLTEPVTITLIRGSLTSWNKHSSGFLGQNVDLMFWLKERRCLAESPPLPHTLSVLCEWWLSGVFLMTNTDCTGGSDPLEWEPIRLLNPPGYSVSVIKVISRLIIALYLQPIHFTQFNCVRANQPKVCLYYLILFIINALLIYLVTALIYHDRNSTLFKGDTSLD